MVRFVATLGTLMSLLLLLLLLLNDEPRLKLDVNDDMDDMAAAKLEGIFVELLAVSFSADDEDEVDDWNLDRKDELDFLTEP